MRMYSKVGLTITAMLMSLSVSAQNLGVTKEVVVNAQPETVWKMVGDFNGLDVWHPVVVGSEISSGKDDVAGAIRVLTLGNGAQITERLQSYSNQDMSYQYEILESPLPVSQYVSTLTLNKAENGATKITWQSSFDANGVEDVEAVKTIAGVYDAGLSHIEAFFK